MSHVPRFYFATVGGGGVCFFFPKTTMISFVFFCVKFNDLLCIFVLSSLSFLCQVRFLHGTLSHQACQAFIVRIFHQNIIAVFSDRLTVRCVQRKEYRRDLTALMGAGVCCDDGGCDIAYFSHNGSDW